MTTLPTKTVAIFIGTRPEAIKMAPVVKAFAATVGFRPILVSTGQHREMLQLVMDIFGLKPDVHLDVMVQNQTLAGVSALLLTKIDAFLAEWHPDFALVQGDTTTVFMAALACFYRKIPVGHVEAGLRTWVINNPFPEELNRTLVTPMASIHFAPTAQSAANLVTAGVAQDRIFVTGNTVIDALFMELKRQQQPEVKTRIINSLMNVIGADYRDKPLVLITGHRRENHGEGFKQICLGINRLAARFTDHLFVYPVHLNPNVKTPVEEYLAGVANIRLIPPQDYANFVALMQACRVVLTDSGGVQEEAPSLGKPVLVMRGNTERPEGVQSGTVKLVGANAVRIEAEVSRLLTDPDAYAVMATAKNPYGDGQAAGKIVAIILDFFVGQSDNTH